MRLVDRAKDLIKSGGEWTSSVAIEVALMDHPRVIEAAVIGRLHPKWDERPVAYIVASDSGRGTSVAKIGTYLADRFPKWQLPDTIILVAELPRGTTDKIDKRALRRADQQHQSRRGSA